MASIQRPSKEEGAEYVDDYMEWANQVAAENRKLQDRLKAHGEYVELTVRDTFEEPDTVYEAEVISSPESPGDSPESSG